MSETETKNPDKTLKVGTTKTLTLKPRAETGVVRQSFSHGRSKAVVVEKVKRRTPGPELKAEPAPAPVAAPRPSAAPRPLTAKTATPASATPAAATPAPKSSGVVLRPLTEEEMRQRVDRLADARVREAEERKIAEEEARRRREREDREKGEREAAEARKREEEDRRKHDEESKRKADEVAKKRFGGDEEVKPKLATVARPVLEAEE